MSLEEQACTVVDPKLGNFNKLTTIPFGCTIAHIHAAMLEFTSFLTFINTQLHTRGKVLVVVLLRPADEKITHRRILWIAPQDRRRKVIDKLGHTSDVIQIRMAKDQEIDFGHPEVLEQHRWQIVATNTCGIHHKMVAIRKGDHHALTDTRTEDVDNEALRASSWKVAPELHTLRLARTCGPTLSSRVRHF